MALRQKVWVDRRVQGVLVGRVLLYWLCALLYAGIGAACFQYNQNPEWTVAKHASILFGQMWPWLPTAVLVLPLAIYDVVRLSNLFVGPVHRIRRQFEALRQDITCAPLIFREDDYWRDLAVPINEMQADIIRLRTGVIDLQQVAVQTTALMANFKSTLPDEQPIANVETNQESSTSPAVPSLPNNPTTTSHVTNPATDSMTLPSNEFSVADVNANSDATSAPVTGTEPPVPVLASVAPKSAPARRATDQPTPAPEEVSSEADFAPVPLASLAQSAPESPVAPAI